MTEILDQLTIEEIEQEFVPCVLNFLETENQSQIEITQRVAELFGVVLNKLASFDIHLKYKQQFIDYFKEIADHKEESIR